MENTALSILSKLGPLRNELFLFVLIAGSGLLVSAYYNDGWFQVVPIIGATVVFLAGLIFWFLAFMQLPSNAQERAFLRSTVDMVNYDRTQRSHS